MSVATDMDWPTPEENAEILRGSANQRAKRGQDQRAYEEDLRDILLATTRGRLAFLGTADRPDLLPGLQGPLVVAFTDEEAALAWATWCRRLDDETPARWSVFPADGPIGGRRPGREWAAWLGDTGAVELVVNPAGPSTYIGTRQRLDSPPRLRTRSIRGDAEPWLDLERRAAARAADAEINAALRDVVARDDVAAFDDDVQGRMASWNAIGSMLSSSLYRFVQGWWSLRQGTPGAGSIWMLDGAERHIEFGDPAGSVDLFLQAADLLEPLWTGAVELSDDDTEVLRLMALRLRHDLGLLAGEYRRDDIDAVLRWLPEVRTQAG